jgi:hypothetical protein
LPEQLLQQLQQLWLRLRKELLLRTELWLPEQLLQ